MTESKAITREDLQPYWEAICEALLKIEDEKPKGLAGLDAAHVIAECAINGLVVAAKLQLEDAIKEEQPGEDIAYLARRHARLWMIADSWEDHMQIYCYDEDGNFPPFDE